MSTKGLPWFRLYAEAVDDEKLRLLAFEDRWHFVAIMCCKCAGLLDAGDDRTMLRRKMAVKLGLASRELDAMADRLGELGLIDPETFQPAGWEGRQFKADSSTDRVRAFRERQAQVKRDETVSETADSVSVSAVSDGSVEKDSKQEPRASRFDAWWAVYPKHVKRKTALALWGRMKLDAIADVLINDVLTRRAKDDGWQQGYVPDPTTYLNQERWNDDLRTAPAARLAAPQQPGKQMQGLMALEEMKRGLVRNRDSDGAAETGVLLLGADAGR